MRSACSPPSLLVDGDGGFPRIHPFWVGGRIHSMETDDIIFEGGYVLRPATEQDIDAIVALLAADALRADVEAGGADRRSAYLNAFRAIAADPAHLLMVVDHGSRVVGTMQLSFLPGLSRGGATRLQVEAVRVADDLRSRGIGRAMILWAVDEGRRRGVALVQLTSDARRTQAHRFYDRLGFEASHVGFKLHLDGLPEDRPGG